MASNKIYPMYVRNIGAAWGAICDADCAASVGLPCPAPVSRLRRLHRQMLAAERSPRVPAGWRLAATQALGRLATILGPTRAFQRGYWAAKSVASSRGKQA